jgi:RHS repeat-associated protein
MSRNLILLSSFALLSACVVYFGIQRHENALTGSASYVNSETNPAQASSVQTEQHKQIIAAPEDPSDNIIQLPESPQMQGYAPTSIKDFEAANPTEGISMISLPVASNTGNAVLTFNMNLPEGRQGMEPNLDIQYNNEAGSTWMGTGWNLITPAIGIDTRWGVPRYDAASETEIYTLNGEQLAPINNRGAFVARSTEKRFYPRVEGAFSRIIRHGNSPADYWWEVTEKDGTRNFYGGKPATNVINAAVLKDQSGNIGYWALTERRDPNDNYISYSYETVEDAGITGSTQLGKQLYLRRIQYTGNGTTDGAYKVEFTRDRDSSETKRKDVTIDARLGFKVVSGDLLRRVTISFNNNIVRSYVFTYIEGAFYKTLLKSISELDNTGTIFYTQEFDYYDDIRNNNSPTDYNSADTAVAWQMGRDSVQGNIVNPLPGFDDKASAISAAQATSISAGVVVTVGTISGGVWSKKMSVGGGFTYSTDEQEGLVNMIDINGDGLPDKVFKYRGQLCYRANLGVATRSFGERRPVIGVTEFSTSESESFGGGGQALPYTGFFGYNHTTTTTTAKVYFSDFNGDGLMDIADDGRIYFNHLNAQGDPEFSVNSELTPSPISPGVIDPAFLQKDTALQAKQERDFPLQDIIRFWEAPVNGTISITAPVQLQEMPNQTGIQNNKKDGVRASIQSGNTILWFTTIAATDFTPKNPSNVNNIPVVKGQRIYFRLQSIYNGEDDLVSWDPIIQYTSPVIPQSDVHHKSSNYYHASEDFILHSKSVTGMGKDGSIVIDGIFRKQITSDSVMIRLNRNRAGIITTLFEKSYSGRELVNENVVFPGQLPVLTGDELHFALVSRSYIDRSAMQWQPHYAYVAITDGTPVTTSGGRPTMSGYPMPDNSNYNNWLIAAPPVSVNQQDTVTLWPQVAGGGDGMVWFSVKGTDTVYARRQVFINGGVMDTLMDSIHLIRKVNEPLFFEYAVDSNAFARALAPPTVQVYRDSSYVDSNGVTRDTTVLSGTVAANLYTNPAEEFLGPMFRGWGHFAFKGDKGDGPLDQTRLNLDELTSYPTDPSLYTDPAAMGNIQDPSKSDFAMLYPDLEKQSWAGYDTSVYIKGGLMSSSRLYMHDVFVDSMMPGAGAVHRISTTETESFSTGVTAGGFGPSGGTSYATTTINLDMLDMNGDRYPDVLNDQQIQYTLPNGGLGPTVIEQPVGATRSLGESGGVGFGGDFQEASTGNKTNKAAVAAQRTAKSSMGLSGSTTWNEDHASTTWMDINGDGLVDRVYENGNVSLNLGYSFAPAEHWELAGIDKASNQSYGGGIGVNIDAGSFEGGFGLSRTEGRNTFLLIDINGDGLPDQCSMSGSDLHIRFNTGNGFGPVILWRGFDDIATIHAVGESANVAITVAIPIYIILMKICINPIGSFGQGTSRQEKAFMDIDGDGFADYIQSKHDGELFASTAAIGRTNMLRRVKAPVGGSYFTMDYERTGNTYQMPQSKWVLKSVTAFDGVRGDGVDTIRQRFSYEGGYQDRHEREFYGFNKITTYELNTANNNTVYRRHVEEYLNTSYYNKGLLTSEWTEDSAGRKYSQTNNVYDITDVQDYVRFPSLRRTEKLFFEGAATPGVSTITEFEYDAIGNITRIADAGDGSQQDMLLTEITYHTVNNLYIRSVPATISVTTAEGLKRRRVTTIDPQGDITQIQQFLADGTAAITNMEYDGYGNMTKLINPANHKNQRMVYSYEYDNVVHSYVTGITDAFNNVTTNTYDYRFGVLTGTLNINNEPTEYTVDNHGRVTRFTGPYELAAGKPYTIAIDYHPEAVVPYAVTRHYDPEYNADIIVINFTDGLGRSVQFKKQVSLFTRKDAPDELKMVVSGKMLYDAFGRVTRTLYPVTEAIGTANTTLNTVAGALASTSSYDIEDRIVKTVLADGATTSISYGTDNGMLNRIVVDALNNRREIQTDARDRQRLLKIHGPAGIISTRYDYNALSELVKVLDNNNNALVATYDNLGRKTSVQHPDAGLTDFEYDLAGNLIKKINSQIRQEIPDGGAIQYQYDYDRLTDIDYPRHYQNKVKYTYGEAGSGSKAGRVTLLQDASGGQEFFYSMQGQIVKTIRTVLISPLFATTYVSEQEYDSWNRLKRMVYPDGEEIMYHYNRGGALHSMDGLKVGSSYRFIDQLGYDEFDQRIYMRYSNGTETIYKYDSLRRRLKQLQALSPLGQPMMNNTYTYDAVSNVLSFVNDVQSPAGGMGGYAKQQFHYDNLYRMDSASGEYGSPATADYTVKLSYDNLHNIVRKSMHSSGKPNQDLTYTYNGAGPHQATQVGTNNYEYDLNGNQLGYGDIENFYDEENRLMGVINKGVLSQYTYDADDNRAVKSSGGLQGIWVNGAPAGAVNHEDNYTVYVSPYISCGQSTFTKHYYIEGQRIASKPGHGTFTNISFPQAGLTAGGVDYTRRAMLIERNRTEYYASLGVSPGPPTDKNFWARPENSGIAAPVFVDTTASDTPLGWPGNTTGAPTGPPIFVNSIPSHDSVKAGYGFNEAGHIYEGSIYFYHADKAGSTNYVTNFQANIIQHAEYSPFGETFVSEQTGSFESSYLFNAKGYDGETGYYYYGPQFYDPALSQWLTVTDPLGDGYMDNGVDGYVLMAESNEDDETGGNTDATPVVSRIAYSGSQESDKVWVDKKMNIKSKDRLTPKLMLKLYSDPRVKQMVKKYAPKPTETHDVNIAATLKYRPSIAVNRQPSDRRGSIAIARRASFRPSIAITRRPSYRPSIAITRKQSYRPSIAVVRNQNRK